MKDQKKQKKVGRFLIMGLGLAALAVPALVRAKAGPPPKSAVLYPRNEIKFADVPAMKGVHLATLEGDPSLGPSHIMLRFDAGFMAPLHHHSADHYGTVVAGKLALTVDGKETQLPAGSFFSFTGKAPHATRCEPGVDCIISLDVRGKWDVVPEKTMASE
jgi:quercetin dioxygenase-like cupin family protein